MNTIVFYQPSFIFRSKFADPFRPQHIRSQFETITGGWSTYSPYFYKNLKNVLNIDKAYDILPTLTKKKNAIFVGTDVFIKAIVQYLKDSHQIDVRVEKLETLRATAEQGSLSIYRISS